MSTYTSVILTYVFHIVLLGLRFDAWNVSVVRCVSVSFIAGARVCLRPRQRQRPPPPPPLHPVAVCDMSLVVSIFRTSRSWQCLR